MRFWKIAQSRFEYENAEGEWKVWLPEEDYLKCFENNIIALGYESDTDHGEVFNDEICVGDFFYSPRNGIVQFCGVITEAIPDDLEPLPGKPKKRFHLIRKAGQYDKQALNDSIALLLNERGDDKSYKKW